MKRFLSVILGGFVCTPAYVAMSHAQNIIDVPRETVALLLERPSEVRMVPGEVIVKYRGGVQPLASAEMSSMGLTEETRVTSGGEVIYHFPEPLIQSLSAAEAEARTMSAVQALRSRPEVEYAQPNFLLHIVRTPNDPLYPLQWHYRDNGSGPGQSPGGIDLPTAWDSDVGDPGVVVAVIDTGILPNHPDIATSSNVVAGFDMIGNTFVANDGDGRDADPTDPGDAAAAGECFPGSPALPDSWHGSHVAGTVGVVGSDNGEGGAGVNWQVGVQAVRALGKCGGSIADINDAIRWAAGLPVPGVPANGTPARVINMSLGGGGACSSSPATQSAINDATNAGATVVVAAGNDAADAAGFIPASCNNVITVAASDFRGRLVTRYSNFGSSVEILAPGGDLGRDDDGDGRPDGVLSTVQGGYAFYNGTSMASPHVAGAAALLLAREPGLTPQQVSDRIQTNARTRNSTQCPRACGAGLLNANFAAPSPPPPPPPSPLQVDLAPATVSVDPGATAAVTATVSRAGAAVAGESVRFASSDTGIATIAPATAQSDAGGVARATVSGVARGTVTITATAQGASDTSTVEVPFLAGLALLVLLAALFFMGYRYQRRTA